MTEKQKKLRYLYLFSRLPRNWFIPFMPRNFWFAGCLWNLSFAEGRTFYGNRVIIFHPSLADILSTCRLSKWQSRKTLGKDNGAIVIDEVCGYFVSVLFLPHNWLIGLYAFALFRVFDIAKPFPIMRAQKIPAGWELLLTIL